MALSDETIRELARRIAAAMEGEELPPATCTALSDERIRYFANQLLAASTRPESQR
jgi:hypothetical protein